MNFINNKDFLEPSEVALVLGRNLSVLEKEIELGIFPIPAYRHINNEPRFHWMDIRDHPDACELFFEGRS